MTIIVITMSLVLHGQNFNVAFQSLNIPVADLGKGCWGALEASVPPLQKHSKNKKVKFDRKWHVIEYGLLYFHGVSAAIRVVYASRGTI